MEFRDLRKSRYGFEYWEKGVLYWWFVSPLVGTTERPIVGGFGLPKEPTIVGQIWGHEVV